jgi:poly(3-hydroxybutyrate) depolymerase
MHSIARYRGFCLSLTLAATAIACGASTEETTGVTSARVGGALHLDIDAAKTSASGLSSGAFMAVQFHVAFSSTMSGVAAFAGGPYRCAQGSVNNALGTCMSSSSKLDPAPFIAATKSYAAAGAIDGPEHLLGQKVFLFGGANDTTVDPAVMDGLRDYYAAFVDGADIAFERRRAGTAHTMPTESHGGDCATTASPYVGKCGYDGAGAALAHLHGPLAPRAASLAGSFVAIAQGDFVASPASHSLADTAYAYVPKSCADGERCTVHVAFHGCKQSTSAVGDAFYKHAGYNEWAETNHVVVLYPQTVALQGQNPNGCWDWWGYDSPDYATKTGPQMKMVKAMVDGLAAGTIGGAGAGAASDAGTAADAAPAPLPAPVDSGSASSCVLATSAEHVAAGRARDFFGFAYAAGSGQPLGLTRSALRISLTRVAAGVYVLGACTGG